MTTISMDFTAKETVDYSPDRAQSHLIYREEERGFVRIDPMPTVRGRFDVLFVKIVSAEEARMSHLRRFRTFFAALSLLCLAGLALSLLAHVAYEPASALFFSFFGIFVVFAMKVRDAKQQA